MAEEEVPLLAVGEGDAVAHRLALRRGEPHGLRPRGADHRHEDDGQRDDEHDRGEDDDKGGGAARGLVADEIVAHIFVHSAVAELDDHSRREAAREAEVVGAPVGAREGEKGEKHGRDDGGDHGAQQLPGAVLLVDEEHHRGEEDLADQVEHLPEEEAARVVPPEEARRTRERRCTLRSHGLADTEEQRQEAERHEDGPEGEEGPKVRRESARLVVPRRAVVARERRVGE
mmetsp:Transcript_41943/g.135281  ORF Transcript_41943/g.135281 Transcript_41943/m.135281 type:complete len:230 (-) Transcript_41943:95-784(-)